MAEFTTFKRWSLREPGTEAEVVNLVREQIIPAYMRLPGCTKLGLLRIAGTTSYLATQHWTSRSARDRTTGSADYALWLESYSVALLRWDQLMAFESEWETDDVLGEWGVSSSHCVAQPAHPAT